MKLKQAYWGARMTNKLEGIFEGMLLTIVLCLIFKGSLYVADSIFEQRTNHCKAAGWKLIQEEIKPNTLQERQHLEATLSVNCLSDLSKEKKQYGLEK